jgi:glycosyltransferase involved in cell wall biosynthesis
MLAWFGIPPRSRSVVLGQVAGLVPYKGQVLLVHAVGELVRAGYDVRALLVGDERIGPEFPRRLRESARALGVEDRIHIRGWPGNIADAWNLIDVHVHASFIDSLPNAAIEGMSLGKPAVVSAVGALPEHVDDGRTGLVVPPGDAGALAAALRRILDDPSLAARLGPGARERHLERFTPEVTARQIESCLEGIARRRAARPFAGVAA